MGCFEKLYGYLENLEKKVISDKERDTVYLLTRVCATLANNF